MADPRPLSNYPEPGTEYLSQYIARIEKALDGKENQRVIRSQDVKGYADPLINDGVTRIPIVWRLYEHSMFYITTLEAGTRVPSHAHPENVFRYVIDGAIDVTVGEDTYTVAKDEWILVRANTDYSIATRSNPQSATLLSAYQYQCKVT